jgi:hypothetical protein
VREIIVRIDTGKVLRILSDDLDAPACEIADLYKRRWAIELFFRWVKQTLKIRHFLGTSENAGASRSPSPSSHSCFCAWQRPIRKPSTARSPSHASCAQTSCIADEPTHSSGPRLTRGPARRNWYSNGHEFKPDSRGTSPRMTALGAVATMARLT